jgi:signal transduction histidine kinase
MRINLNFKYIVTITCVLCIVTGVTFELILQKHEQMIISQVDMQAKALFKQVVITRRWVAEHGGVFIKKLPWMEPNPYLRNATITDATGKRYVRENPAMVTKQLSQYAEHDQLFIFHITSLKLMNPENAPDEFETKALKAFESKQAVDASTIEKMGSSSYYYRYIAPLYVENACLECHNRQGYKVGDVRGAISVSIPMDYARTIIALERRYMLAGAFFIATFLIATLYLATRRMVIGPVRELQKRMLTFSRTGTPDPQPLPPNDEIGDLSRTFDDMARELRDYHVSLQDKVRAATRELTDKNESLARASRSKSDFIAQTSHELRTPLTAIKGAMDYLSVKLIQRGSGDDKDLQTFFEMIKKNADRLIRLVNNILDYERIELGTVEMNFMPVNLRHVFQEVIIQCAPLAEQKQVTIHLEAEDVTAVVDEDRMKQVLTNLLSNALAFSPASSTIRVSLLSRDEQVIASVDDEGPGVSEHDREKIFRQFYTKDVKDGTGLGLAICRGIIDAHDGSIGLESSPQGGSRFWFTIPRGKKVNGGQEKKTAGDR